MWAHYPTSRRKKMITVLTKPPDSHTADHSQKLPSAAARLSSLVMPLPLKNYVIHVSCGKGEARRVQPDNEQLCLYQFPDQALFALDLSSPWEGARGRHRKTQKVYFAFCKFFMGGNRNGTQSTTPVPMQQQPITQQQNNMGKYLMV